MSAGVVLMLLLVIIRSPVLAAQVDRLVEVSFDGLFPRDVQ